MKKLFAITLIALSGFALPSCGDDDNAKTQDPTPTPAALEGTWHHYNTVITTYDANGNPIGQAKNETYAPSSRITQTFTAPSTYTETKPNSASTTGSYVRDNAKLTITNNNSGAYFKGVYDIDSLTATRLVIRYTLPSTAAPNGKDVFVFKSVR